MRSNNRWSGGFASINSSYIISRKWWGDETGGQLDKSILQFPAAAAAKVFSMTVSLSAGAAAMTASAALL